MIPSFRQRLWNGPPVHAAFLFMGSPDVAEIMALAGYDALVTDREHAAADLADALHELRAIQSVSRTSPLVRVRENSPAAIKPLLDAGFEGILIADVRSAEDAKAAVKAAKYPPLGERGAHFTVSRAASYGDDMASFATAANEGIAVIAMIESMEGVAAIDDIAAVPGIDMLFIGPLDLTGSLGCFGNLSAPRLMKVIQEAEARILATGKMLGGAMLPSDNATALFARGYRLVTSASDVGLLKQAARNAVGAVRNTSSS